MLPVDAERTVLRHTLAMGTTGISRLTWPLAWRPMHDACPEDGLDRAESAFAGTAPRSRWSPYARYLRALAAR
ncbi:hypothetical protein [Streptomyces sp. NPDC002990]